MAIPVKPYEHNETQQIAQVQTVRGRIKTAVEFDGTSLRHLSQIAKTGTGFDETPLLQVRQEISRFPLR